MLTLSNHAKLHLPQTHTALQAAEGYVYLGLYREALKELDGLSLGEQENCEALIARIRILLHLERWAKAARLSAKGATLYDDEDEFTVQRAFALHQLNK